MSITTYVERELNGALHHAKELDDSLVVAIEKFEDFSKTGVGIAPEVLKILKLYKDETSKIVSYVENAINLAKKAPKYYSHDIRRQM